MRLRHFFPAAVFFLAFGIAFTFAAEPADEKDRRETIYPFRVPATAESSSIFAQYFSDNAGNNSLTITLIPYKRITLSENVWSFSSARLLSNKSINTSDEDLPLSDARMPQSDIGSIPADAAATDPAANRVVDEDRLSFYDFSIPFSETITEEIGFTEPSDSDDEFELSFLKDEFREPRDSKLSENGLYASLVFHKKAFLNSPNSTHILFGGDYNKKISTKDDTAGISFSTPVALFFLTLGVGLILVMYTASGKKEY